MLNSKKNLAGYLFISPWLLNFLLFVIVPILSSLYFAFTKYDLLSEPILIGLDNFSRMFFEDTLFIKSLIITFTYVFITVPLRICFALFVAMLLAKKHKGIQVYRTIYYIPSLLGGSVAISLVWRMIFGLKGPLSYLLAQAGYENFTLIGRPDTAMVSIIALMVWQFGSSMLIFLAGLKNIPVSYYESAVVDGAGPVRKFFRITLPLLSPVILFNVIMQTINGFIIFTQVYIVTKGGPVNSTMVFSLYMFKRAFKYFDMGYASAMAWFLLIIIGIITAIIFKSSHFWVYYESGEK